MNNKISTRVGMIAGFIILAFNLFLLSQHLKPNSPIQLVQFLMVFIAIIISSFVLQKYYDAISFIDYIKHGLRTLSTLLFIVIVGNCVSYMILRNAGEPWSNLTFMIMKTIFAYSVNGILSAFFTSFIFNTFTKK